MKAKNDYNQWYTERTDIYGKQTLMTIPNKVNNGNPFNEFRQKYSAPHLNTNRSRKL